MTLAKAHFMLLQYVVCLDCWPFFQGVNRGQQNYIFLKETSINIIYKQTNKVFSFECNIYYLIFSCCTAHTPFHYGCFTHFKNIGALVSTTQLKIFNQPFQYSPWISLKNILCVIALVKLSFFVVVHGFIPFFNNLQFYGR